MSGRRLTVASTAAAPATPLTIFGANLLQWVNGNRGTLSSILWQDQSGNGLDYTSASMTVNATDATLNNLKTASFDGLTQAAASTLSLPQSGTTPTCVLSVLKYRTLGASQAVAFTCPASVQNNWCYYNGSGASQFSSFNGVTAINVVGSSVYIGAWARTRNDFSNSAGDITKIGNLSATGNAGNAAASAFTRTISGFAANFAAIDVWELIYLNIIPSPAQMTAYDAYVTAATGGAAAV